jgi:antitoxin component HigA of HigAB toxin-antitoxin module
MERIFAKSTLKQYWEKHSDSGQYLKTWYNNAMSSGWKTPYPIESPDPIEAIKIRMEEMQLKQIDLADALGGRNRVSEVLNRKRKLTVGMIRNLTARLNLSPGLLITDYQLKGQ